MAAETTLRTLRRQRPLRASVRRCSIENCRRMVERCSVALGGSPQYGVCSAAGLVDSGSQEFVDHSRQACSDVCNESESGDLVQCIADLAPQCDEKTRGERGAFAIATCLKPDDKVIDPACVRDCDDGRFGCQEGCGGGTFKECGDCVAKCGLSWSSCVDRCPRQ